MPITRHAPPNPMPHLPKQSTYPDHTTHHQPLNRHKNTSPINPPQQQRPHHISSILDGANPCRNTGGPIQNTRSKSCRPRRSTISHQEQKERHLAIRAQARQSDQIPHRIVPLRSKAPTPHQFNHHSKEPPGSRNHQPSIIGWATPSRAARTRMPCSRSQPHSPHNHQSQSSRYQMDPEASRS
jgi:hypothetical protein